MSTEFVFDDKGKVRPKPSQEMAEPQKEGGPLTAAQIQSKPDAATLTRMQQTMGNAAVQRFLAQRSGAGPTELDDETAAAINQARGGGQSLDQDVAAKAGHVMGQDFSSVQVHSDSHADHLSRQLGAKAFTTGNDIFFREGAYSPQSSDGQRLISHELTHVVQQGASVPSLQGKMTVNDPNDQYEAEADSVADMVMSREDDSPVLSAAEVMAVHRQEEEEELAQMQEEEEELQMQAEEEEPIQRQAEEEEIMA